MYLILFIFWLSGVLVNLSNLKLHVAKRDNVLLEVYLKMEIGEQ
jgi:hypothetical protein